MYTRKYAAAGYTGESECSILFACTRAMSMVPEASRILFSTQGVRIQNGMTACGTVLNLVPLYSWRLLRRYRSATAEIGRGYRRWSTQIEEVVRLANRETSASARDCYERVPVGLCGAHVSVCHGGVRGQVGMSDFRVSAAGYTLLRGCPHVVSQAMRAKRAGCTHRGATFCIAAVWEPAKHVPTRDGRISVCTPPAGNRDRAYGRISNRLQASGRDGRRCRGSTAVHAQAYKAIGGVGRAQCAGEFWVPAKTQ